tara:strand:- start:10865 stop:11488 length:624 start_codon:yes stop_codon:yes gene_type:complete
MLIPKQIVQTSRKKPEKYIIDMIKLRSNGWEYNHFDDMEVIQFFALNPIPEFPNVIQKFFSFNYGEHRADLFRYYYLYVKGGVYFDTDAMIECDINEIVKDYEYFSVNSSYFPGTIFQGFIGCVPKCQIIYKGLHNIYHINNLDLIDKFRLICKNMHTYVHEYGINNKIKLYQEVYSTPEIAAVVDDKDNNKLVLNHYHIKKQIPNI